MRNGLFGKWVAVASLFAPLHSMEFHFTLELTIFSVVDFLRICGEDPNFSILEVENTDLCLTPQTGEKLALKRVIYKYILAKLCVACGNFVILVG